MIPRVVLFMIYVFQIIILYTFTIQNNTKMGKVPLEKRSKKYAKYCLHLHRKAKAQVKQAEASKSKQTPPSQEDNQVSRKVVLVEPPETPSGTAVEVDVWGTDSPDVRMVVVEHPVEESPPEGTRSDDEVSIFAGEDDDL